VVSGRHLTQKLEPRGPRVSGNVPKKRPETTSAITNNPLGESNAVLTAVMRPLAVSSPTSVSGTMPARKPAVRTRLPSLAVSLAVHHADRRYTRSLQPTVLLRRVAIDRRGRRQMAMRLAASGRTVVRHKAAQEPMSQGQTTTEAPQPSTQRPPLERQFSDPAT
jgi:hypothetical protein